MKWYKNLYLGETAKKHKTLIMWKIKMRKFQPGMHLVTLATNPENLLDILPAYVLLQKHYPTENLFVVGMAGNRQEALSLIQTIVNDVYQATGGFDIAAYMEEHV